MTFWTTCLKANGLLKLGGTSCPKRKLSSAIRRRTLRTMSPKYIPDNIFSKPYINNNYQITHNYKSFRIFWKGKTRALPNLFLRVQGFTIKIIIIHRPWEMRWPKVTPFHVDNLSFDINNVLYTEFTFYQICRNINFSFIDASKILIDYHGSWSWCLSLILCYCLRTFHITCISSSTKNHSNHDIFIPIASTSQRADSVVHLNRTKPLYRLQRHSLH